MSRIKFRDVILITLSLIVIINFVYFRYIYSGYKLKRETVLKKIDRCDAKTAKAISDFNKNMNLLRKIVLIKREILFSKRNIELLESNHTTTFDMSNILKTLLVKSGVYVYDLSLFGVKNRKIKRTYSFRIQIDDKLNKILKFMDLIESYSDNMYISNYNLRMKNGSYNITMTVNFDYVSLR